MHWPSFERASHAGPTSRPKLLAFALGWCSAVPALLLAANVGLIVHVLLAPNDAGQRPRDWFLDVLQGLIGSDVTSSSWWGRSDYYLLALIAAFLILSLLESVLMLFQFRAVDRAVQQKIAGLQRSVCDQVSRLAADERVGRAMPRPERLLTARCEVLRDGLARWWKALPRAAGVVAVLLLVAVTVDFFLTLCALLLVAFVAWIYDRLRRRAERESERTREPLLRRREALLDRLHTARSIATCSPEPAAKESLAAAIGRYHEETEQAIGGQVPLEPSLFLLVYLGAALVFFVVGLSEQTSLTHMAMVAYLFGRAYLPLHRLRRAWNALEEADASAAELFAYLDRVPTVGQIAGATQLSRVAREVRIDDVSLSVGSDVLLDHVSFSFPAGARVVVLAWPRRTGRAVADLLLRFCDPDTGRILLDDADLRTVTLDSLRQQMALAPADGGLFTGTVADNIVCGRTGFGSEHVERAARLSGAMDAVEQLPNHFQTTVGPQGRRVSRTLAFQIGLARAVLTDPSLLVIDEPLTTGADEDAAIDVAIVRASQQRATVVLGRRLPTLRDARTVYVLRGGRLHAQGPHAELLRQDAFYRHVNYLLFHPFRGQDDANETD